MLHINSEDVSTNRKICFGLVQEPDLLVWVIQDCLDPNRMNPRMGAEVRI